jgi:hypothetical protein
VQVSEELIASGQVKLSMQQKESTLEQLKQDMWLGGDENEIYIGVRFLLVNTINTTALIESCTSKVATPDTAGANRCPD